MVPLNSWPMVMGRVSLVTGWGVTGEKLESVGQWLCSNAAVGMLDGEERTLGQRSTRGDLGGRCQLIDRPCPKWL